MLDDRPEAFLKYAVGVAALVMAAAVLILFFGAALNLARQTPDDGLIRREGVSVTFSELLEKLRGSRKSLPAAETLAIMAEQIEANRQAIEKLQPPPQEDGELLWQKYKYRL